MAKQILKKEKILFLKRLKIYVQLVTGTGLEYIHLEGLGAGSPVSGLISAPTDKTLA